MSEYVTIDWPVVGQVDVPKKYTEVGKEDQLWQYMVDQTAKNFTESGNEFNVGEVYTSQRYRAASSSLVGAAEKLTGERKTSMEEDFLSAVMHRTNPLWASAGELAGSFQDPVMIPNKLLAFIKVGGTAVDTILQSTAAGGFGGLLEPVREEQGMDMGSNVAYGSMAGALLGVPFAIVAKRMEMSPQELVKALDDMPDDEVEKVAAQVNQEILRLESPETFDARKTAERTTEEINATGSADRTEQIKAEQLKALQDEGIVDENGVLRPEVDGGEEYRALKNQFNREVNAAFDEANKIAEERQIAAYNEMKAIKNNLPSRGEREALNGRIKNIEHDIETLDAERQRLMKMRKGQKRSEVSAGNKKIEAINAQRETRVKELAAARKQEADIARMEGIASDVARFDETGEVPAQIKELEFNDPRRQPRVNKQPTRDFETPSMLGDVGKLPTKTEAYQGTTNRDLIPEQPLPEAVMPPRPAEGVGRVETLVPRNKRRATEEDIQQMQQADEEIMASPPATPAAPSQGVAAAPSKPTGVLGKTAKALDYALGNMMTRLQGLSPRAAQRLAEFDFGKSTKIAKHHQAVDQFGKTFRGLPDNLRREINVHLMSGRFSEAMKYMTPELRKEFMTVRKTIDDLTAELKSVGIDFPEIKDYFPRKVKEGQLANLRKAIRGEDYTEIENNYRAWANANGVKIDDLSEAKKAEIADQTIRGIFFDPKDAGKISVQKKRTLKTIDPELEQFYDDPVDSLLAYIENTADAIERAKFFGRGKRPDVPRNTDGTPEISAESIGAIVKDAIHADGLNREQADELIDILKSRFQGESNAPNKLAGGIRDIGYLDTIADIKSAFVQFQDMAQSLRKHGFANTIAAAFGKKDITAIELGIEHTVSHELQKGRATAKLLNKALRASGFNYIDRLGKETIMNAAHRKHKAMLKSKAGEAKFRAKYKDQLGDRLDETIRDIRNDTITENVKFLAMNNISELQPVTMSQMPQAYANMSGGRVVYMLKSFTLKQLDVVRREVIQEARKGNIDEAAGNMLAIAAYLSAAGVATTTVTDWALGKEVRPEDLGERALWSLLGVFGMNQYMWDRYLSRGDLGDGLTGLLKPPTDTLTLPYRLVTEATKEEPNFNKFYRDIPIFGTILYYRLGDGAEKYNERLD